MSKTGQRTADVHEVFELFSRLVSESGNDPDLVQAPATNKRPLRPRKRAVSTKHGQDRVVRVPPWELIPAPENELVYRPLSEDEPEMVKLIESVRRIGVQNPIVATLDNYVVGGHRRRYAAYVTAQETVPVRYLDFRRRDDPDRFMRLLREDNLQRDKTIDEKIRENLIDVNAEQVYQRVSEFRKHRSRLSVETIAIEGVKRRWGFADQSKPFVDLIIKIVEERRDYWPLSVRSVHYRLLEHRPLTYVGRPASRYSNLKKFSAKLSDFLSRMRLCGMIPWEAIHDETRPVELWNVHSDPSPYINRWGKRLFLDYYRNLMQSQPCHIEGVCEKLTVTPLVSEVFSDYTIPLETGRGYDAITKRWEMAQRFEKSGKDKLVVLMLGDFDPEGQDICHAFARSMRDDFNIDEVAAIKVALTRDQIDRFNLPPMMKAKEKSSRHKGFVEKHGDDVWELDALEPEQLQKILRHTIDSVIDIDLYNQEVAAEREDQRQLAARRTIVFKTLGMPDPSGTQNNE